MLAAEILIVASRMVEATIQPAESFGADSAVGLDAMYFMHTWQPPHKLVRLPWQCHPHLKLSSRASRGRAQTERPLRDVCEAFVQI